MTEKDDGGPAFPHSFERAYGHGNWSESQGLSLRDWFAGQALANPQLCSGHAQTWEIEHWFGKNRTGIKKSEIVAKQAAEYADAMLKARKGE